MKVTDDLIKLGKKSLEMFDAYIAEKKAKPQMRSYSRYFITDLKISEAGLSTRGSSEIIEKPDWSEIIFHFMEEKIKPMPELTQLGRSIAKRYKNNINKLAKDCHEVSQSAYWLTNFIKKLIYEKLEDTLSDDSFKEYASLFKLEIELSSLKCRWIYHLDGIFLETDSIRINDNVLIRKTRKDDLEYTKDLSSLDIPAYISDPIHLGTPLSISEIDISYKDEKEYHEYKDRIFNALRLYKLGSIYSLKTIQNKRTIIWPTGPYLSWEGRNYFASRRYTVKETEIDTFINFINTVEQKLNFDREEKKYRVLYISIDRYNSALLEAGDVERKLMIAVMGLESLFTFEKDRGENTFKLGIRVAKLLGYLNFDVEKVRQLTEEAYRYRNRVVHGSYLSQKDRKTMYELLPTILNYLRTSLIIFILKSQDIGKSKMIEKIEKSMISDKYNRELKDLLEKEIEEFREILYE